LRQEFHPLSKLPSKESWSKIGSKENSRNKRRGIESAKPKKSKSTLESICQHKTITALTASKAKMTLLWQGSYRSNTTERLKEGSQPICRA